MADNNFLIELVTQDPSKTSGFIQELKRQNSKIAIPTPVLAEFMVRDENESRTNFLAQQNNVIQTFNFDQKSALLSAKIMRELLQTDFFSKKSKDKQIIKVDIQILGITLANGIPSFYSTDTEIAKIIQLIKLPIKLVDFKNDFGFSQNTLF